MDRPEEQAVAGERGRASAACTHIFLSPTRAFDEIGRGAGWLWPFLVCLVLGLVIFVLSFDIAMRAQLAEIQARNPQAGQNLESVRGFTMVMGILAVPVMLLAGLAISAGIFFAAFQVSGLGLGYKQIFRGVSYAALIYPAGISALVTGLLIVVKRGGDTDLTLADLTPRIGLDLLGGDGVVRGLLSSVNPFSVWWLVVLVYGFARLSGRPRAAVLPAILGAGLLWMLATGALAGLRMPAAG